MVVVVVVASLPILLLAAAAAGADAPPPLARAPLCVLLLLLALLLAVWMATVSISLASHEPIKRSRSFLQRVLSDGNRFDRGKRGSKNGSVSYAAIKCISAYVLMS